MARMHRLSVCATMALRSLKLLPRAKGTTAATSTLVRSTSEALDTEFKRRYPPDQFGKEMDDNARVWQVLRDEASAHDHSMLDEWNKTLDILLIFVSAGWIASTVAEMITGWPVLGGRNGLCRREL